MHPTARTLLLSALTAVLLWPAPSPAQETPIPDSLRRKFAQLALPLLLRHRTVVALYPYAVFDSAARYPQETAKSHPEIPRLSRLADSLGFDFVLRPPANATIQDERYAAVYRAPTGRKAGFILFAPGLRPQYIPPDISESHLAEELKNLSMRARRLKYRAS